MDQRLLESLGNLSLALEEIALALKDKREAQSATAKAMKGGDFIKEIQEINLAVKDIQKDTKQILANQQTIMKMGKAKKEETDAERLGGDKKSQNNFKDGIKVIMLIAVAVLAIGAAFLLIGKVNFLSVIALSLALPLLAIGFAKVHTVLKEVGFDPKKDATRFIIAVTSIAVGIMLSSYILSMITPLSFAKFFTATFIALMFAMLAPSIMKFMLAFKGMSWSELIKSVIGFPLILPAIALGMALSSYAFQLIKPISFVQFLSAVGIAAVFAVAAFGLRKIIKSFDGLSPGQIAVASLMMPILFVGLSYAIALSSVALGKVKPVSFIQFLTSIGIAAVFTVLSIGAAKIANSVRKMTFGDLAKLPIFFTLMSIAITASSWILSMAKVIPAGTLFKILLFSIVASASIVAVAGAMWLMNKMGVSLKDALIGGLLMVVVSVAIMISSHILALGNYKNYPSWKWALGVGLSLIAFTPAIVLLGAIAMSGVGALAILAGAGMVLVVAATITAASYILSAGKYGKYPPLAWSASVAISMAAFTVGMVTLGALIVGTFGLGGVMLAAGSEAVLMVADTIVKASHILSKGKYTNGPTLEWAGGIALALGAFSPVYAMLMANQILSLFGGGGVGPKEFSQAIITVSKGIVDAAGFFAKNKVAFANGPSKAWSEGVGLAIGAFAPVYKMLEDFPFSGGQKMSKAIITISKGIIDAANIFAKNKATFNEGYPSKKWGEGVGAALGAFAPVFKALHEDTGWFTSGDDVINNMKTAIKAISWALVSSAKMFSSAGPDAWKAYPTSQWAEGVKESINSFIGVYKSLSESDTDPSDLGLITRYTSQMAMTALILGKNKKYFDTQIDPNFVKKMSKNILDYQNLVKSMSGFKSGSFASMIGLDPVQRVANGMVKIASAYDRLARAVKNFSSALNSLNPGSVNSFTRLTGNLAVLSAMDSGMFSNMLTVLEKRSGVFAKLIDMQDKKAGSSMPQVKAGGPGGAVIKNKEGSGQPKDAKGENQLQKLDKIIFLLTKMNNNVGSIDEFLKNPKAKNDEIGKGDG